MVKMIAARLNTLDRELVREAGYHHLEAIGQALKFAITAFFTGRTKVIARNKQHLDDGSTELIELGNIIFDNDTPCSWSCAGGHIATVYFDVTNPAGTGGVETIYMAKGRDIYAIIPGSINQRLTGLGVTDLSVDFKS